MPLTPDDVLRYLDAHGIAARTYEHPAVHTVAESQALRGDIPGAHTKNLFLRDGKKTYFLVTLEENTPVDLKGLRAKIGARGGLSFASPEALFEHLGVLPGSVSLLALVNDPDHRVQVVLDASLLAAEMVNCHPLSNEKTTSLTPAQLAAFLAATGHSSLAIDLEATVPSE
ncbi:prolyl-tRNA synthetase associated domain-containing protein [Azorhizobium doebereinerae]|uniref:prolyl-tRNA synthetase associated domain-containing protein n=1 Tax=Azorhizobium doebereinerae TaxID=281091 RepID=UPI0003FACD26|nr:prolyl-tRNA synthetase associated domain-containing protein [Azorhizobium doebereinerae]